MGGSWRPRCPAARSLPVGRPLLSLPCRRAPAAGAPPRNHCKLFAKRGPQPMLPGGQGQWAGEGAAPFGHPGGGVVRAARVARSCLQWITECCHYVDTKPKDAVHRLVEWFTIQVNRNACPGPLSVTTPVTAPPPPPRRGLQLAGAPPPCAAQPPLPLHAPARHPPPPPPCAAQAGRWPAGAPAGGGHKNEGGWQQVVG